jgi:anti-anti-sigma regulatory factor
VTHRIHRVSRPEQAVVLEFQGLLDAAALAPLEEAVAIAAANGSRARIVLREGSEVDRACLGRLASLDADVVAEAPWLARWIAEAKISPAK